MDKTKTIVITILATVIGLFVILCIIGSRSTKAPTAPATPPGTQQTTTKPTTATAAQPAEEAAALTNEFAEAAAGYSMKYPADWTYEKQGEGWDTIVFSGKRGTDAYRATVNIQNILTKANGGKYATATELMESLKTQFKQGEDAKIVDEQPLSYTTKQGETIEGSQVLAEYVFNGEQFKQWQIVIPRPDGKYFHAIAYTAPADLFNTYISTARAMINTWTMRE